MQTVYLNGEISKFGEKWETSCNSLGDILRLIECQTPGFRQHLIKAADAGIDYQVMKGKELLDTSSKTKDLHIKLPFLKNKNQKEYFIIKPKKPISIIKVETTI